MSRDGFLAEDEQGNEVFVYYDELERGDLSKLFAPLGGFCYEVDGFARFQLPKIPFYLKDWLPKQGKGMIYGQAKVGKSYLAIQLARCIGAGVPFLGIPTQQGRVLYLQFELGLETLQARFKSTGQQYPDVYVGTTFSMKLDRQSGQDQLEQAIVGVEPKVVVIDPFFKVLGGDENESHDVLTILNFLDKMIESYGCTFLIMHHMGKDSERGARGTSTLADWHDSMVEMKKVSKAGEPLRIKLLPRLLRHAELPPESVEAVMDDYEFEQVGAKPTVKQQVAEVLQLRAAQGQDTTIKELMDLGLCATRSPIYEAVNGLIRLGVVARVERGSYRWIGG